MKYLSLFTGIGGFELGIGNDSECVGYSEIDKYAIQIYQSHFPDHHNYGDITKIEADTLPDFDLLVGGFPCQAFSIAGKRKGFNDTRGTLFFDIARIIKAKQPRLFVLENVKGLLSHDNGSTFRTIIATLDDLGYDLQWQVLNSKDFCVPQNRERVFIVGNLRGTSRPKVFPITKDDGENKGQPTSNAITANYWKGIDNHGQRTHIGTLRTHKDGEGFREVKSGISPTIPARAREDGSGQPVIVASRGRNPSNPSDRTTGAPTEQRLEPNEQGISNTLTSVQKDNLVLEDMRIRRLTPIECERLQGFPDKWTEGISETQRYKCLGNAVTVNVVRDIMSRIKNENDL